MKALLGTVNLNNNYSLDTMESPTCVYLKVTGGCDLRCSFCSQATEKKMIMNLNDAKKILDELKKVGVISINYTGGEPLLYKNIDQLLEYGYNLGFDQTLVTNGVHLFDDEKILKYVNSIGISLHGKKETHDSLCGVNGTYDIITKNIDKLLKEFPNIKVLINYTLSTNNINDDNLNFVFNYAKDRNIKLCFGRLNYLGASLNTKIINPNDYLKKIDEFVSIYPNIMVSNCIIPCSVSSKYEYLTHSCGAGQTIYAIEANGDVKICPSSTYVLGNIFKNSFSKIIHSKSIKEFQSLSWLPNICTLCKKFPSCKGGCHAEGNKKFYENTCDALLINRFNIIWETIKDKKMIVQNYLIRKAKKDYLIIKVPLRKINSTGYKLLSSFDGTTTCLEILKNNSNIENIKDFIITLYIENIIKEKL